MLTKSLPLLSLLFLVVACDFFPHEEILTEIEEPDLGEVSITLNTAGDTIALYQPRESRYYLNGPGIIESLTFIIINGDTLLSSSSRSSLFTIDANELGTGSHKLNITSVYSKRTNSLAGQIGLEIYSVSREWLIIIDIDPPNPVQIISIEQVDGVLKIDWDKYSRVNFQNYQLLKRCYDSPQSVSFSTCKYIILPNKNTTTYLDTEYTSGKVEYIILVQASNQLVSSDPYVFID